MIPAALAMLCFSAPAWAADEVSVASPDGRAPDEATAFRLPQGSNLWYHDLEAHNEGTYVGKGLQAVPSGGWMAPPAPGCFETSLRQRPSSRTRDAWRRGFRSDEKDR
jgi:hypothetical protein